MSKHKNSEEYLDNLRHSTAHLLAAAVMQIYPHAKRTIGPSIENGFYFDFDFGDTKISEESLPHIEEKMREILHTWDKFERIDVTYKQALAEFSDNEYKEELIHEFSQEGQELSMYKSGDYSDLCRGGHIDDPKEELKYFKLLSVAGAYWRGSEKNKMLTRIYGTAWPSQKELDGYLNMLEEAKRRDHKILGQGLDLFTFSELVGGGLPLWTPKGTLIRNLLDDFVWELRKQKGYQKVEIPHITKKELYETSGHWDKFADELFHITTRESHEFAMKPMNCPHHTQIYNRKSHSYRDLPQRYANTTMVYRDEQSGELSGLSRVRSITQDDAHVFCRETQVVDEALGIWDIIEKFYEGCGFPDLSYRLSLHDPNQMEKYLGDRQMWKHAENQLRQILEDKKVDYVNGIGEAAFYGPKIDIMSKDSLGRIWQVATIQVDRNMPKRFGLTYVNENGEKEQVVMLHAAIMVSIERFMSILIEHFEGRFPVWISPVQVKILPITEKQNEYAAQIIKSLQEANIRVEIDDRNETLQAKIRDGQLMQVPYMIILGVKEAESGKVSVRKRTGESMQNIEVSEFLIKIKSIIESKSLEL